MHQNLRHHCLRVPVVLLQPDLTWRQQDTPVSDVTNQSTFSRDSEDRKTWEDEDEDEVKDDDDDGNKKEGAMEVMNYVLLKMHHWRREQESEGRGDQATHIHEDARDFCMLRKIGDGRSELLLLH
eukprot:746391-Hanusia_phi.AAC.11